jgi:uncharacterized protein YhbP (UPF0306 family)
MGVGPSREHEVIMYKPTVPAESNAPSMAELVSHALSYIAGHRSIVLATHGPEGLWAAPVFYVNEGFTLYFLSLSDTRHVRNIVSTGNVAATISDDVGIWERIGAIQLEGTAAVAPDSKHDDVRRAFRERYSWPDTLWWSSAPSSSSHEQRIYVVHPRRLFFVNHEYREARFEIPAEELSRAA